MHTGGKPEQELKQEFEAETVQDCYLLLAFLTGPPAYLRWYPQVGLTFYHQLAAKTLALQTGSRANLIQVIL